MRPDLTDITLVVDRSGSMSDVQQEAECGINAFIQAQAKEAGNALLTLVQFDTEYEFLHRGVPINKVPKYRLVPRGMTALLDAVGRAVNETGSRLANLAESDRPGLVIFVVMTDGLENSSSEFTKSQVKRMIELQQQKYSWHFTFLGANQDAFSEAASMGIAPSGAANFATQKIGAACAATMSKVARMRGQRYRGDTVDNAFTDEERGRMS